MHMESSLRKVWSLAHFDVCVLRPSLAPSDRQRKDRCVSLALAQTIPACGSDLPLCWRPATLAQEALCITPRCGQEPCKALPMTDKHCLVWIKRKNKALGIIEADGENTELQNERKGRV